MENGEPTIKTLDAHKREILGKINNVYFSLGDEQRDVNIPEYLDKYKNLKGKKVLMVDDIAGLICAFAPSLMVATDGNMSFIFTENQSSGELMTAIIKANPDVVLLDYNLARGVFFGSDIAELLKANGYTGKIIGFSTEKIANERFDKIGIKTIEKDGVNPAESVKKVAEIYSSI